MNQVPPFVPPVKLLTIVLGIMMQMAFICANEILDYVILGNPQSEREHRLRSDNSEIRKGGLGETCRVILPRRPASISGGSITVTMQCDPRAQNYLTARLWGGDVGENVLFIVYQGKRLGAHGSDWPPFDKMNWREKEPRYPGRFFYSTYILPQSMTRGKSTVTFQLISRGRLYGYASSFQQAQHKQTTPSQGIYRLYIHTNPFFVPPPEEKQGHCPPLGPCRPPASSLSPYEYALRQVSKLLSDVLKKKQLSPSDIHGIALALTKKWSPIYNDREVVRRLLNEIDRHVAKGYVPSLKWVGPGELAEAVELIYPIAQPFDPQRKKRYAQFFRNTIDYQTEPKHRGGLTNQDIYITTSIYRCNRLLKRLAPQLALPEAKALDYVYQAMGLRPYKGRHIPGTGTTPSTAYRCIMGGPIFLSDHRDYYWITPKGSSKEHGFVPHYGELAWQTATLAEITGDRQIKQQAIRMIRARAPFRILDNDAEGYRAMRIESVIGWRHCWYAGRVEYADIYLKAAAVLGDPVSMRLAQLYLQHNRIYEPLNHHTKKLYYLVSRVDAIRKVQAAPPSRFRFPMDPDQPDFAWADEGIRTIAFKHKNRRCYMTLGWRAAGINNIARVHFTEPEFDRIANIRIRSQYTPSGKFITRPKELLGNAKAPEEKLLTDGERLPLANRSLGGMADFYYAEYGPYVVIMNCTGLRKKGGKTFSVTLPAAGRDLITNQQIPQHTTLPPATTRIVYLGTR